MLRVVLNPHWAARHFTFANSLIGGMQMEGANNMTLNLQNRQTFFLTGLELNFGIGNPPDRPRFWVSPLAEVYGRIVSSLNRRQWLRLGVHGRAFHTTWKSCVSDIQGFIAQENLKERDFLQAVELHRQRLYDAGGGEFADQWDEDRDYQSPPLCIPIGRRFEELALLILFKEDGMWKSIVKDFRNIPNPRPSPLVFHILKSLDIHHVKVIPGVGAVMDPLLTDPLKECYKVCGSLYDGHREFNVWKRNFYQHHRLVFDVKSKRTLTEITERDRLRRND